MFLGKNVIVLIEKKYNLIENWHKNVFLYKNNNIQLLDRK